MSWKCISLLLWLSLNSLTVLLTRLTMNVLLTRLIMTVLLTRLIMTVLLTRLMTVLLMRQDVIASKVLFNSFLVAKLFGIITCCILLQKVTRVVKMESVFHPKECAATSIIYLKEFIQFQDKLNVLSSHNFF